MYAMMRRVGERVRGYDRGWRAAWTRASRGGGGRYVLDLVCRQNAKQSRTECSSRHLSRSRSARARSRGLCKIKRGIDDRRVVLPRARRRRRTPPPRDDAPRAPHRGVPPRGVLPRVRVVVVDVPDARGRRVRRVVRRFGRRLLGKRRLLRDRGRRRVLLLLLLLLLLARARDVRQGGRRRRRRAPDAPARRRARRPLAVRGRDHQVRSIH